MKRSERQQLAERTLGILDAGFYENQRGESVDIAALVQTCCDNTRLYRPEDFDDLVAAEHACETRFEVCNQTTLEGADDCLKKGYEKVAALNFASAKNPGGGFLGGSQAQEESLARSSGLYPSLLTQQAYYDEHRAQHDAYYSDRMIYSPACPVFRDDEGELLDEPQLIDIITSPAPNAGAIRDHGRMDEKKLTQVFRRRIRKMLLLAASQGCDALVLGAWGCGVFRNDPADVAALFYEALGPGGEFENQFAYILFSVYGRGRESQSVDIFRDQFDI